jgi:hypothetical protein
MLFALIFEAKTNSINMRFLFTLLFPLIFGTLSYAQVITYEDFKTVIRPLEKEDFKTAFEKTNTLLDSTKNDSSDLRGIVTYMNIYSSAGMVSRGQMNYDDFSKNASKYVGQRLVMRVNKCIDSSANTFNALQFVMKDGELQGQTVTANKRGTSILCFEYFKYSNEIDPEAYIGENVRCGGTLASVDTNPNKSTTWIARLHISNAFARIALAQ